MANLKFTSTGSTTVTLGGNGLSNNFFANNSAYTLGTAISLADGETVEFYGTGTEFSKDSNNFYQFSIGGTGTVTVEGDLVSLINNNQYIKQYQFMKLFAGCDKITSIANLVFPASIADWCYANMFMDCTGLVNAGTTLPATGASRWCYQGMFARCSSMTTPPTINATKLAPFCYYGMFTGCTSLTTAPDLKNFVVEGELSNNIMFKDCSSLNSIKVSFTTWPAEANEHESRKWLNGVSQTGVFKKLAQLTVPSGVKPQGWTVETWQIPTITLTATIPTFSFDGESQTNIVSSLLDYVNYTGNETLNCQIEGELPTGISASNGVLTGIPSQFENNYTNNFNVIYSAQDVLSTLQETMPLEIINSAPDYENMPITFAPLSGAGDIRMMLNGPTTSLPSNYNFYYKKNTDSSWSPYIPTMKQSTPPASSIIHLNEGQSVSFSGTQNVYNTGWDGVKNTFSSSVEFKCYGRLDSLTNSQNPNTTWLYSYAFCNQDNGHSNQYYSSNIVNFRNLIFPQPKAEYYFDGFFGDNGSLSCTPVIKYSTGNGAYKQFFFKYGSNQQTKLVMQFAFDTWYSADWQGTSWSLTPTSPVFIVPSGCNYVSNLTSVRPNAKIVYRNQTGLFYNNQQIDEQTLLDTGEIVTL